VRGFPPVPTLRSPPGVVPVAAIQSPRVGVDDTFTRPRAGGIREGDTENPARVFEGVSEGTPL
jgi:hypothetical protein